MENGFIFFFRRCLSIRRQEKSKNRPKRIYFDFDVFPTRHYLILAVTGFILPGIFVAKVSFETGNILFYTDIMTTIKQMFANDISTAFVLDLLFVVFLFLFWTWQVAKKLKMKRLWLVWIWTFAFGIASGLPLFLYLREVALEKDQGMAQHFPQCD